MGGLRTIFLFAVAFFGSLPPAFAQDDKATATPESAPGATKALQIHVKEMGTGRPLRKVEVKFGSQTEFSGPDGTLTISGVKTGDRLEFSRFGFEKLGGTIEELGKGATDFEVYLTPSVPDDNEVRVSGVKRQEVSKIAISKEESIKVAPNGDPAQVTKLLPGVQTRGFDNRIVVRGSGPDDSIYMVDDVEVPFLFHIIGNLSIVPDQLIDEVEFSSGGFGPRYGNATGGTVALKTKNTLPENSSLELTANFPVYSGVFYQTPIANDGAVSVSFRRSYIQYLLPTFLKAADNKIDISVVPYFGDIHAQYLKVSEDGYYKFSVFNSHDGLQLTAPIDVSQDESGKSNIDILNSFTNVSLQNYRKLDSKWSVTGTPHLSDISQQADFLGNKIRFRLKSASVPVEFSRRLDPGEKVYFGVEYTKLFLDLDLFVPDPVRDDPFYDFEEAPKKKLTDASQFHAEYAWVGIDKKFGDLTASPGVRFFNYSQMKEASFDPRLALRYQLGKEDTLKGAVGQYSKTPEGDETDETFGNPDLDYEESMHNIIGWEHSWSDKWSSDLQAFYKKTIHAVARPAGSIPLSTGSLKSTGFEAFIRRNATARLFGWLSYTYSKNYARNSDQDPWGPSQFDQTHILTLVGDYKISTFWDVGGRTNYHTGDTYTPVKDAVYNANLDKYQPQTSPADLYSARKPNPLRISLFATRDFLWPTWNMQLKFGVEELLIGHDAVEVDNNYDYSKERNVQGVPAIPYLEVRARL
jgi:hypothetical protein